MAASIQAQKLDAEIRRFGDSLNRLATLAGDSAGEMLWKYSAQFVGVLVARTQPKGRESRALPLGEGAVLRDINLAYPRPGAIYRALVSRGGEAAAGRFWEAWKNRDWSEVEAVLRETGAAVRLIDWDQGEFHSRGRDRRGRFRRGRAALVKQRDRVKKYAAEVKGRVMWAKAGWVSDFRPPGGVRGTFPQSVKRHRSAPGRVVDKTKKRAAVRSIDFQNHVEYVAGIFRAGDATGALRLVGRRMARDLEKELTKRAARAK